jgi:sulfur carrier protein
VERKEMQITVNGETKEAAPDTTVRQLLDQLHLDPGSVVAELNGEILDRLEFDSRVPQDGDTLELIRFVGGG